MLRASKSNIRRKRLRLESLENRRLLAGDVTAEVVDGDLLISGDQLSNLIELRTSQDGIAAMVVAGLPGEDGELTTINGEASFTATGVTGDVVAAMRNGDDLIYVHDVDLPGNLLVRTGNGNDTVLVGGLPRGDAPLPEPIPAELIDGAIVDGDLIVPGDPVDPVPIDPILPVANTTINGNARIVTGAGTDGIAIGSVEVFGNLAINSGRHDDVIRLGVNELPGPADEVAPSVVDGVPSISLPLDVFGSLTINTGGGDDQAWLESVYVARNLRANLGSGGDLLSYDWGAVAGRINVNAGGGDDIVVLSHVSADVVAIHTRGGNDGVGLIGVSTRRLNVHLGAGDDQMLVADTSARSANFNGGAGFDTLEFDGSNHLPRLRLLNFEIIS